MFLEMVLRLEPFLRGMSFAFSGLGRLLKCRGCGSTLGAWLAHVFARSGGDALFLGVDVGVQTRLAHLQFHLRKLALARSPSLALAATPPIRAQNEALRPLSVSVFGCGAGAFR